MTTITEMTVAEIAKGLVEKCRNQDFQGAVEAYYSPDIVSIESMSMPGHSAEVKGLQAIAEKAKQWYENTEVHSCKVSDPLISDDEFAVVFDMDVTCKQRGRMTMKELAVYEVRNGKITRERFVYNSDDC
jgi:ketosteroid isomerase-like protein